MRRFVLAIVIAFAAVPASAEPPHHGQHEIIFTRPSGFWTSNRPAPPGYEYKWRLLGIGVAVGLLTGMLLVRTIKRANAERAARQLPGAQVR